LIRIRFRRSRLVQILAQTCQGRDLFGNPCFKPPKEGKKYCDTCLPLVRKQQAKERQRSKRARETVHNS
jgi:uncharacterized Zn finger protein (UPF0148 family)